jgi:hypothetical protein
MIEIDLGSFEWQVLILEKKVQKTFDKAFKGLA